MKVLVPLVLALGIATPAGALDAIGEIGANLDVNGGVKVGHWAAQK